MRRTFIALLLAAPFLTGTAFGQERPGAGRFEVGAFPVGGVFFTGSSSEAEPAFANFALGTTLTFNVNRWIGMEGEVGNAIGLTQNLRFQDTILPEQQSPCLYAYNGNVIVNPVASNWAVVPYATVGVGGLTLRNTDEVAPLGLARNTTYFAANVGGGLKWYAHRHWGLRGDYRLLMVNDKPAAPEFFAREGIRYGHRVYGGLLFNY